MKRAFYIFVIIAIMSVVGYVGYSMSAPEPEENPAQTGSLPGDRLGDPIAPAGNESEEIITDPTQGKFGIAYKGPVKGYFAYGENDYLIVNPDGAIVRANTASSTEEVLSETPIANLSRVSVNYDGTWVMAVIANESTEQINLFNVREKEWELLPNGAFGAAWSPNDHRIAYVEAGTNGARRIMVWNPDAPTRAAQTLTTLYIEDMTIAWPHPTRLGIGQTPSAEVGGYAWIFDTQARTLTPYAEEKGLSILWDPSLQQSLVLSGLTNNRGGMLSLRDSKGSTKNTMSFLTMPSKCIFSNDPASTSTASRFVVTHPLMVCAIPRDQETLRNATLPDHYLMGSIVTVDDLFAITTREGNLRYLPIPETAALDIEAVTVANGKVYFIDRYTENLYVVTFE